MLSEITLKAESRAALKDSVFLHIARCIAELGTCDRKHVGAVFTRAGRCIAWGFNGAPPGMPHCDHVGSVLPCTTATHAEANALAFAAREGISVDRTTLYVSVAPCDVCARLLIAAGISRVVAYESYRDPAGVDLLKEAGVVVQSIES